MSSESLIQTIRIFHYTTGLPVYMSRNGRLVYSLPDEISCAADIAELEDLAPEPAEGENSVQYLITRALEAFLFLYLEEGHALLRVGPFLHEPVGDAQISQLIRRGVLPFGCRKAAASHYAACPVLDEKRSFYSGKLLEALFLARGERLENPQVGARPGVPVEDAYYVQTYDYRSQQFMHAPYAIEQEICRAISNGNTDASKHILAEINRMPKARLASTSIRSLKNSLICSCTFMARAAIAGGVSPDEAFTLSDAYIQCIEQCATTSDLSNFEAEMIEGYTARVQGVKSVRHSGIVNDVMRYIDNHLSEPITVQTIADSVYHNPNYLSGLFKKETSETLHSYILRKRIEESLYFVRYSKNSFAEIAAFYQFCSQSHFVQCFRRFTGCTPGEYRRSFM